MIMKINTQNEQKITATVDHVEAHSRTRNFGEFRQITKAVEASEAQLNTLGIPKKHWTGCCIEFRPEAVPLAYAKQHRMGRATARGTYVLVERFVSGWFMTICRRDPCPIQANGGPQREVLILHETAKRKVRERWDLQVIQEN